MLARIFDGSPKLFAFLRRHRWSLPLSALSLSCFVRLAWELEEGELGPFDTQASLWVQSFRGSADSLMVILTRVGDGPAMAALGVVCFVLLLARKKPRDSAFLAMAAGGTGVLNTVLKLLFHRARPEGTMRYLVDTPSSFSFPSGHTMGSTGVMLSLVVLAHVYRLSAPVRVVAFSFAAAFIVGVATSRVYLGVHFPSDVLGGLFAGAAWVSAVTGWFYPRLLPGEKAKTPL